MKITHFRYRSNQRYDYTDFIGENVSQKDAYSLADLFNHPNVAVYEVLYIGDPTVNWLLTREGIGMPGKSFKTKKEAVKSAKKTAKKDRPSVLVIYYQKGKIQDWYHYPTKK